MPEKHHPMPEERDERFEVPLDPANFVEGVLAVDPESEPVEDDESVEEEED